MQKLRILFEDESLIAIDKPPGILVHPPEDRRAGSGRARLPDVIRMIRAQTGKRVYPVHRLDRSTSGVLLMAFESKIAGLLQKQFQEKQVIKTYLALVRGYTDLNGEINSPLTAQLDEGEEKEAFTTYETCFRFELPIASSKHETSRFSMVKVSPHTGRLHQIRRHLKRIAHPIIGDTVHGDGTQNRIWRELTKDKLLYLKAYELTFFHPVSGVQMKMRSRFTGSWHKIFDQAGACPLL